MPETLLRTKLYIPPLRPNPVPQRRLIERLSQDLKLGHKLAFISVPARTDKTTLASEWLTGCEQFPRQLHLVIATDEDPLLSLVELRMEG